MPRKNRVVPVAQTFSKLTLRYHLWELSGQKSRDRLSSKLQLCTLHLIGVLAFSLFDTLLIQALLCHPSISLNEPADQDRYLCLFFWNLQLEVMCMRITAILMSFPVFSLSTIRVTGGFYWGQDVGKYNLHQTLWIPLSLFIIRVLSKFR